MSFTPAAVQTLALQETVALLTLGFGVLALRVAPRPGSSARTAAWFMAGVTFTLDGVLAVIQDTAAVAAVAAGRESAFYRLFVDILPVGNDARSVLVLGFAAGLAWVLLLGRPTPSARAIVAAACLLLLVGSALGLAEPPVQQQGGGDHIGLMSLFGAATALLLFASLYRAMVRESVDWLLWTALALYAAHEALSSNIQTVIAWAGFRSGWAPPVRAMMWVGLVTACVMVACSMGGAQGRRVVGLQKPQLHHPPGNRLLGWASFLFSRRDVDEVIEPAITDMRIEYNDALLAGRPAHARWIRIRGTYGILITAASLVAVRGGRLLVTVWRLISK